MSDLEYLKAAKLTKSQFKALRKDSLAQKGKSIKTAIKHFTKHEPTNQANIDLGKRCEYVASEHRRSGGDFEKLVAEALRIYPLRMKGSSTSQIVEKTAPSLFPDEVNVPEVLVEGATKQVLINAYERNPKARRLCIEAHGTDCFVCGFSFNAVYGKVADGVIHVHHLRPLSEIEGEYVVDPVNDLRPVCPNCHVVLHLRKPPFSIEDVKTFMRDTDI